MGHVESGGQADLELVPIEDQIGIIPIVPLYENLEESVIPPVEIESNLQSMLKDLPSEMADVADELAATLESAPELIPDSATEKVSDQIVRRDAETVS